MIKTNPLSFLFSAAFSQQSQSGSHKTFYLCGDREMRYYGYCANSKLKMLYAQDRLDLVWIDFTDNFKRDVIAAQRSLRAFSTTFHTQKWIAIFQYIVN